MGTKILENSRTPLILMKINTRAFFGLLNRNLKPELQNSKWRIQYADQDFEKFYELVDFDESMF